MFNRVIVPVLLLMAAAVSTVTAQDEPYAPEIDPANFVEGIDNPYLPYVHGTTFIYQGEDELIIVTVTDETRTVMGVECMVVRDRVWEEGELIEDTFDWVAQDIEGNIWYFGEDSREIEDGAVISTEGSWEAGVDGALPGILMPATPEVGAIYRQEYYEGEAEDMAEVIDLAASESVAYGSFEDVLVTREWNPLEGSHFEHKYYVAGLGLILEASPDGEDRVELIEVIHPLDSGE